jgi:RNA methyltransferase, TrmH family
MAGAPRYETISSASNPRLRQVARLRESRTRIREGLFVVDSLRDLERALAASIAPVYLFISEDTALPAHVASLLVGVPVLRVAERLLDQISYRENADRVVAVLRAPASLGGDALTAHAPKQTLLLVGLSKPGNVGALLRTADACGFDAIVLADAVGDRWNPNLIRASTGACFLPHIYEVGYNTMAAFSASNPDLQIIAASVDGEQSLYDVDFSPAGIIMLGTEDQGLPANWQNLASTRVRIPMVSDVVDSLNVSVSGALFMYESFRQRRFRSG